MKRIKVQGKCKALPDYAYCDNRLVHVDDSVPHKDYYCPYCLEPVYARKGAVNRHHYYHPKGSAECKAYRKTEKTKNSKVVQNNILYQIADLLRQRHQILVPGLPIKLRNLHYERPFILRLDTFESVSGDGDKKLLLYCKTIEGIKLGIHMILENDNRKLFHRNDALILEVDLSDLKKKGQLNETFLIDRLFEKNINKDWYYIPDQLIDTRYYHKQMRVFNDFSPRDEILRNEIDTLCDLIVKNEIKQIKENKKIFQIRLIKNSSIGTSLLLGSNKSKEPIYLFRIESFSYSNKTLYRTAGFKSSRPIKISHLKYPIEALLNSNIGWTKLTLKNAFSFLRHMKELLPQSKKH